MANTLDEALEEVNSLVTENQEVSGTLYINNDLRTIALPNNFFFGVYNDKDVRTVQFRMERFYDETDLSEFKIQINYVNGAGDGNVYYVEDSEVSDDTITFEWVLGRGVFVTDGTVSFVVCLRKANNDGTVIQEFNTTIARGSVLGGLEVDENPDPEAYSILTHMRSLEASTIAASEAALDSIDEATNIINAADASLRAMVGAPYTASTAAAMIDTSRIYVYVGNESGYEYGHWYYYNRTSWVDGGVYNATAIDTDKTLSVSGMAADGKVTGDRLTTVYTTASNAENEVAEVSNSIKQLQDKSEENSISIADCINGGYVENGVAYFTHNDEVKFSITGIGGGGSGGGGSDNNAVMTLTNTTGWLSKTISVGSSCPVSFTWSSLEEEIPTGSGTMRIIVNNTIKYNGEVAQGSNVVDLKSYLGTGSNVVKIQVSDLYGNTRTVNFSISAIALSLSSTFDIGEIYTGSILVPCTPVGAVSKTIYALIDGNVTVTQTTSVTNRQLTFTVPAQSHGHHLLTLYFESEINGEIVRSNVLNYDFISVSNNNNTVVISSQYMEDTVDQYTTINIPHMVYNPSAITTDVDYYVNGELYTSLNVDRTFQTFSYRANISGSLKIKIVADSTSREFSINVKELSIDVEAETDSLVLYLSSNGRSNNEEDPSKWSYGNIEATLSDFNYVSDGWQRDEDGITALRTIGDARATIPYMVFASDPRSTGKTIEIEYATRDVLNYDATVISMMTDGRGIEITAQMARLVSEQSNISTQYKEDEHNRITFVISKASNYRLLYVYINGIASGVVQYPEDDDFSQAVPVGITIGSNECTTDIYCIRVYDNDLTRHQIVNNWIADSQVGPLLVDRYNHNNVYDDYGNVDINKLPSDLPYLVITCPELPQYKGDKKTCSGYYVDPLNPANSFTFENCQIDVQGTSSQYYPRKNYKQKFRSGFTNDTGITNPKYAMNAQAIPTNTFTMKADVASSEGANNVELARLYNDACPYKTPAQELNSKVRQGIDGFPIVMFWNDGSNVSFIGKYNFNNDKGTEEVFGFTNGDESWEIRNNTGNRVIFKSADYDGDAWLNDFEARYPDQDPPYVDPEQLRTFAEWVVSTDSTAATNQTLPTAITYDGVEYNTDSSAYRLAKFKAEASNYMELDSAFFYYLFTELFLMVDSRAKNAFPSFIGSEVVG